ncbi:SH3 domain-binding protein 5-like [Ylistrum balloti]|uniref:SH3 domain-binding protein 5-like n=1 Tax=Ylistrum balloti TaxID=509963 RepID=UPI002905AA73|nr:SH3 domain-binding protein 5-like [Ylistrum balloti]
MEDKGRGEGTPHLPPDGEEDEQPDPRVKEARSKYRMTFTEASHKMALISKDKKKSIQKAREYYELREEAKKVQSESLKSARQYQSAIGIYRAAKETVALAEERLLQGGEVQLTSAWQEMLNHATIRVMEAEREKRMSEEKHLKATSRWRDLENRIQELERKFKRAIANARGYFEMKQQLDLRLQQQKQNVLDLQQAIKGYKLKYAESLRTLEQISESIHESRRQNLILMFPRQPGVGAESANVSPCISELTLDKAEGRQTWMSDDEVFDDDDDDESDSFHKLSINSVDSSVSPDVVSEPHSNDITKTGSQVHSTVDDVISKDRVKNRSGNVLRRTEDMCKASSLVISGDGCVDRYAKHEFEGETHKEIIDNTTENIRRLAIGERNDTKLTQSFTDQVNKRLEEDVDLQKRVLKINNTSDSHDHPRSDCGTPMLELNTKYLERNLYNVKGE